MVELGEGVSAAFCAKLFGDYGAEVIKIEKPAAGDTTRHWGPYPDDIPHPEKKWHLLYAKHQQAKRHPWMVDTAKGRELLVSLISTADVLIENYMPQQMKDWGLDYASLSKLAPNMIMISITPFGQTGPYANWKAYDLNTFHLTGAGSRYCGRQGEAPLEHGTYSAEYYGAYVAATWGLASVFAQDEVGGEHIDVSCAEAIAATFVGGQNIGGFAQDGVFGSRTGVGMPLAAPATILPCKDGHVWMLALEAAQWHGLVNAMGNPDWAQLEMFDDMFTRATKFRPDLLDDDRMDHAAQQTRHHGSVPAEQLPFNGGLQHPGCCRTSTYARQKLRCRTGASGHRQGSRSWRAGENTGLPRWADHSRPPAGAA